MSTTLTWASSGNGTKTGTAMSNLMSDISTLIGTYSANAAFSWQVAGSSVATTPFWLVLSRKDGSAGRIAIIGLTTAFTNIQPTLWEQLPSINNVFIAWFPNGTGSTLSNLNATSGTVCGNDTGAVRCSSTNSIGSSYTTSFVPFYWDSYDGMWFFFNNPASATLYGMGAGALVEDAVGTAFDATAGSGGGSGFSAFTSSIFGYTNPSALVLAGALPNSVRVNHTSGNNKQYFNPWQPLGWAAQAHGSTDCILADDVSLKAWFMPFPLMSTTKGEGITLKFRQMGYGPGQSTAYFTYYTTGPVAQAMQISNVTAGGNTLGWFTNFKI